MRKIIIILSILFLATPSYARRTDSHSNHVEHRIYVMEDRMNKLESKLKKLNRDMVRMSEGITDTGKGVNDTSRRQKQQQLLTEITDGGTHHVDDSELLFTSDTISEPEPVERHGNLRIAEDPVMKLDSRVAEREFYDDAFSALRENRIDRAEKLLLEFITKFPNGTLLSNAHYWLGEIYYGQRKYKDASFYFLSAYQSNPSGNKAPDSVLKLALSLEALDNVSGACATLIKLTNDFPQLHHEIKRQAHIEISKLRCNNG